MLIEEGFGVFQHPPGTGQLAIEVVGAREGSAERGLADPSDAGQPHD
jgi:hypothetical protein